MKRYIVIGAGILGASTAYHLAKAGAEVTIIDREDKGQATDAAAGIVCPWISQRRNKRWYNLVKHGAKFYPQLIEELKKEGEEETGYQQVGAISIHTDEERLEKMMARTLKRKEDAPEMGDIRRLSKEETKEMFPPLSDEYAAVFISGAARVDGRALKQSLLRAAQKKGAVLINKDAQLLFEQTNVIGVQVENENIMADSVIVTAGAWAKQLLKPHNLTFQVAAQKAQIIHLEIPETDTSEWPVVMPPTNQYLLAFDKGRVVIGATHEDNKGFDQRVTAGGVHEVLHKALLVAPELTDSTIVETRVGFRPHTPDFLPVFGEVPGRKGLLVGNGLGASGLTAGPFLGAELAKLATGEKTTLRPEDYSVEDSIS
ncbi:FAD-dependent oxidoreductase [Bacillus spongiae]|uniref:FAD-dependent oxidoreductase n=1 Tax=Bacillus spongiae TaxID=2683610 RepID=A0ABU8HCQ4_9BACI